MATAPTDKNTSDDAPESKPGVHIQQKRQLLEQLGELRQQYARQAGHVQELRHALEEAAGRIDTFSNSLSWRLVDKPLRLLMRPQTLGRGDTELDAARRRIEVACALDQSFAESAPEAGPLFRLEQSEWVTRGGFSTTIIVLNRDGQAHLEKLFSSYLEHHQAMDAEWVVVDHHSSDRSRDVVRKFSARLPISLVAFDRNHSFSWANNFAALLAAGENLVFCRQ